MSVSVVIRVRDEAPALERTLRLLAAQDEPHEVIVVDDCSTDGSPAVAAASGATVVTLAAGEFSFGRALNRGCERARGEVLVALSAHAYPPDESWLARVTAAVRSDGIACACGYERRPDGSVLRDPWDQDAGSFARNPFFGYSNGAGGFRRDLWRQRPFREDMPGTEDREWAGHWLAAGWRCRIDPALVVEHDHGHESIRATYARELRELRGYAMFTPVERWSVRDLLREWWSGPAWHRSRLRARLDPRRIARLAAGYRGRRTADDG